MQFGSVLLQVEVQVPVTHLDVSVVVLFAVQLLVSFLTPDIDSVEVHLLHLVGKLFQGGATKFQDFRSREPISSTLATLAAHGESELVQACC